MRPTPTCRRTSGPAACCTSSPSATGKRLVFYCAFGERSAMAVQAAQDAGIATACHIHGGIDAWKKADGAARALTPAGHHVREQRRFEPFRMLRPADALPILQRRLVLVMPQDIIGQQRHRPFGEFAFVARTKPVTPSITRSGSAVTGANTAGTPSACASAAEMQKDFGPVAEVQHHA